MTRAAPFFLALLLLCPQARAWDRHATLMPWVLGTLPASALRELSKPIPAPCPDEDRRIYSELQAKLQLNPSLSFDRSLKPTAADCKKPTTASEILSGGFVDDPDQGMDKDLPDSYDPGDDRAWMGGKTGPTSQGFRHMYFGGWKLAHPIETFQIPFHAVGLAPDRALAMAAAARELFQQGRTAWGWRVLSWEIHYLQDLAQPFHSVQLPSPRMLPWKEILGHPGNFIAEATRGIANYHWAYEGLVRTELELGERSPLNACLREPGEEHTYDPLGYGLPAAVRAVPALKLARAIALASVKLGNPLAHGLIAVFGDLTKPGMELALDHGAPDYEAIIRENPPALAELNSVSCHALANAALASQHEILESLAFLQLTPR